MSSLNRASGELSALVFTVAALAAALAPLAIRKPPAAEATAGFPGWPTTYEAKPLHALPMTARETAFARDFPGRIARFSDGEREIVLRWVSTATRRLHPAQDCFRGLGYKVSAEPMRMAANGAPMSCFRATGTTDAFDVCEQMTGSAGDAWPDVSSWYWHALWQSRGPSWWSVVVATPVPAPRS